MQRLRGSFAMLVVLSAPAVVLVPFAVARGDDAAPEKHAPDAGAKHDPENQTALAEWMDRCVRGNAKYVAHDVAGATELYREAIQLAPKRPLPHYLLGEALLGSGSLAEAEAAFNDAEQTSDDRDPVVRGKILFVLADVKEREKKWEDAKAAWQAYGDYASKHGDAGVTPATPLARIQSIDDALKQDKAYEVVRQRIQDESKDAGARARAPKK